MSSQAGCEPAPGDEHAALGPPLKPAYARSHRPELVIPHHRGTVPCSEPDAHPTGEPSALKFGHAPANQRTLLSPLVPHHEQKAHSE